MLFRSKPLIHGSGGLSIGQLISLSYTAYLRERGVLSVRTLLFLRKFLGTQRSISRLSRNYTATETSGIG